MKVSILMVAFMAIFITGCGKDSKKKSSSPAPAVNVYPYTSPTTSQEAYANLTSWYNSAETISLSGVYTEVRRIYTCKTKWEIFTACSSSNTSNKVVLTSNALRSSYPKLAAVFSAPAGSQMAVSYEGNNLYKLQYLKANGAVVEYKLDLNQHAAVNPILIYDSETMKTDQLVQLYYGY